MAKETEIGRLNENLKEMTSSIEASEAKFVLLKNKKDDLYTKSLAQETEIDRLKQDLKEYTDLYETKFSNCVVLDPNETSTFKKYLDFANAYAAMPQSTISKVRLLKKEEIKIRKWIDDGKTLYERCE